jgi:hypothetical protein
MNFSSRLNPRHRGSFDAVGVGRARVEAAVLIPPSIVARQADAPLRRQTRRRILR